MTFDPSPVVATILIVGVVAGAILTLRARLRGQQRHSAWLRVAALFLSALAAFRPVAGAEAPDAASAEVDVVIMIDRTTSMGAEDYAGRRPRLDGVAADVASLANAMPAARFGVVVMDNQSRIALPLTTDTAAVVALADTVGWRENAQATGSDIMIGVADAKRLLEQSVESRPRARRYLVYLGDGEQTAPTAPTSGAELAPLLNDAMVLGYGTARGGPMRVRPGSDEYVVRDGVQPMSTIDENNLQAIADQVGGRYLHRDQPGGLEWWTAPPEPGSVVDTSGFPVAWLLALAALGLLLADTWVTVRDLRRSVLDVDGTPAKGDVLA